MHRSAAPSRREMAFAMCLALVLGMGVLGVLLLNTSMQQQSRAIADSHVRLDALTQHVQALRTTLDWTSDPAALARQARELRLRPVRRVEYVRLTRTGQRVSVRLPEAGRAHGG